MMQVLAWQTPLPVAVKTVKMLLVPLLAQAVPEIVTVGSYEVKMESPESVNGLVIIRSSVPSLRNQPGWRPDGGVTR